nr:hypothetical protein [Bradyrhizobium yuanmingense]
MDAMRIGFANGDLYTNLPNGKTLEEVEQGINKVIKKNESYVELRADFQHLRRWRKSVEQAQSYTFKAVITVIATGLMGAVWLGIKVVLGK